MTGLYRLTAAYLNALIRQRPRVHFPFLFKENEPKASMRLTLSGPPKWIKFAPDKFIRSADFLEHNAVVLWTLLSTAMEGGSTLNAGAI